MINSKGKEKVASMHTHHAIQASRKCTGKFTHFET